MALRDQPYIPLYVQDYMTDEKLNMCSAATQGVYIKIMCVFHKSEQYGGILLKQKDKQNENICLNFACKLARVLPFDTALICDSLNELLDEQVLHIDGDFLYQKRMVTDNELSIKRSFAGKNGGKKTQAKLTNFASDFAKAKVEANSENENENEDCIIVDNNDISNDVIISDNTEKEEKEKNGSKSAQTAQGQKTAELSDIFINDMETIESGMIVANLGKKSGKNAIFKLDFVMESFKDLVKTWLDYKKSRGQTYKTPKSIEIFYKKLIQFSGGDLNTATEIVERAIANNWAGIFELKNNQQNGTTQRHYTKSAAELKAERDREFEARIYAKLASGNNGAGADDSLPF